MNIFKYTLSDLLMFSPEAYARLIELYNQSLWPLQLFIPFIGIALIWLIYRPAAYQRQLIMITLAIAWFWVGYGFHYNYYASINWFAYFYALTFFLQGFLLLAYGILKKDLSFRFSDQFHTKIAIIFLIFGVFLFPLIGLFLYTPWQTETFGLMSTPTLITTLAILLLSERSPAIILMLIPSISAMVVSLTAWAIGSYESISMLFVAVITISLATLRKVLQ